MFRKCLFLLLCACLSLFVSTAIAFEYLNMATGPAGGTYYPVGTAMCKIWTDNIEGLRASAQSTGGTFNNISLLGNGGAEASFADGLYYDAYFGMGPFQGEPQKFLRGMAAAYPEIIQLVVSLESGVNSFKDLKGKRVSFGSIGGSVTGIAESIFKSGGLDPAKDIKIEYMGHAEAAAAFADDRIDAAINMGAIGISSVSAPMESGKVKLISLPEDVVREMCAQKPYFSPATIPAGTYRGQTAAIHTFQSPNIIAVLDSLGDELVYNMTKELFLHKPELVNVAKVMEAMRPEGASQIRIPLHPGAEKYYREIGVLK